MPPQDWGAARPGSSQLSIALRQAKDGSTDIAPIRPASLQ